MYEKKKEETDCDCVFTKYKVSRRGRLRVIFIFFFSLHQKLQLLLFPPSIPSSFYINPPRFHPFFSFTLNLSSLYMLTIFNLNFYSLIPFSFLDHQSTILTRILFHVTFPYYSHSFFFTSNISPSWAVAVAVATTTHLLRRIMDEAIRKFHFINYSHSLIAPIIY